MEAYDVLRQLGAGAFGTVYLVRCKKTRVKLVAKEVQLRRRSERLEALREVEFLRQLQHPNIIAYHDVFEAPSLTQPKASDSAAAPARGRRAAARRGSHRAREREDSLFIVMAFADGGDLEQKVRAQREAGAAAAGRGRARGRARVQLFGEGQVVSWLLQLLLALKHVHDRKILHRDIKSQNIFLTSNGMVKLGDFGIARGLESTRQKARTQIGTPYYLSPEICQGKSYDHKSDMWAVGVVLYEMMSLRYPFEARNMRDLMRKIVQTTPAKLDSSYSRELRGLAMSLLSKNPARRPSVNDVLRMPFLCKHISRFLSTHVLEEEFSHTVLHSDVAARSPVETALRVHRSQSSRDEDDDRAEPAPSKPKPKPKRKRNARDEWRKRVEHQERLRREAIEDRARRAMEEREAREADRREAERAQAEAAAREKEARLARAREENERRRQHFQEAREAARRNKQRHERMMQAPPQGDDDAVIEIHAKPPPEHILRDRERRQREQQQPPRRYSQPPAQQPRSPSPPPAREPKREARIHHLNELARQQYNLNREAARRNRARVEAMMNRGRQVAQAEPPQDPARQVEQVRLERAEAQESEEDAYEAELRRIREEYIRERRALAERLKADAYRERWGCDPPGYVREDDDNEEDEEEEPQVREQQSSEPLRRSTSGEALDKGEVLERAHREYQEEKRALMAKMKRELGDSFGKLPLVAINIPAENAEEDIDKEQREAASEFIQLMDSMRGLLASLDGVENADEDEDAEEMPNELVAEGLRRDTSFYSPLPSNLPDANAPRLATPFSARLSPKPGSTPSVRYEDESSDDDDYQVHYSPPRQSPVQDALDVDALPGDVNTVDPLSYKVESLRTYLADCLGGDMALLKVVRALDDWDERSEPDSAGLTLARSHLDELRINHDRGGEDLPGMIVTLVKLERELY